MTYSMKKENLKFLEDIGVTDIKAFSKIDTFYSNHKIVDPFESPFFIKRRTAFLDIDPQDEKRIEKILIPFFFEDSSKCFYKKTTTLISGTSKDNIQNTTIDNWGAIDVLLNAQNLSPVIEDNQLCVWINTSDSNFQIIKHETDNNLYVCFSSFTKESLSLIKDKLKLKECFEESWIEVNAEKLNS